MVNANDRVQEKTAKKEELEKMFQTGEQLEFQFRPFLNTKEAGASVVFEFIQDTAQEFTTKAGGKRHGVIIRRFDLETKDYGDKERTGFPKQLIEKVRGGLIEVGKKYMITYTGKKPLAGGHSFNEFVIKPITGTK